MQADMLWNRIGTYSDDVLEHNWNEVSDLDAYSDDKKRKNLTKIWIWWYVDSYTDFNNKMCIQINHVLNLFVFLYSTHFKSWYAPTWRIATTHLEKTRFVKGFSTLLTAQRDASSISSYSNEYVWRFFFSSLSIHLDLEASLWVTVILELAWCCHYFKDFIWLHLIWN